MKILQVRRVQQASQTVLSCSNTPHSAHARDVHRFPDIRGYGRSVKRKHLKIPGISDVRCGSTVSVVQSIYARRDQPLPTYLCFSYSVHSNLIITFPLSSNMAVMIASRPCSPIMSHNANKPGSNSWRIRGVITDNGLINARIYAVITYGACLENGCASDWA